MLFEEFAFVPPPSDKRREEDKFVVLDLKTPFSVRGQQLPPPGSGTSGTTSADLGIFFKGGSAPTAAATSSQGQFLR